MSEMPMVPVNDLDPDDEEQGGDVDPAQTEAPVPPAGSEDVDQTGP